MGYKEKITMPFKLRFRVTLTFIILIGQFTLTQGAGAISPKQHEDSLEALTFLSEVLQPRSHPEAFEDMSVMADAAVTSAWNSFHATHGDWSAIVDKRTEKIEISEGKGIPFVPGLGNQLQMEDVSFDSTQAQELDLADLEAITRDFLPSVADLLGVASYTLILNQSRSGHPVDYLWFVDFDVMLDGIPIEDARVVFRVNNGNLIQFGSENLPAERLGVPEQKVTRKQALIILATYVSGFSAADFFLDGGSQHLVPVALADHRFSDGFEHGQGRGLARAWQFVFRRDGDHGTWRARIDATSGKMLEFRDVNDYVTAQVTGGVTSFSGAGTRPMPFVDVSSGGYTNSAGVYDITGSVVSSTLSGQYVQIDDNCGAISLASDLSGNLAFGSSSGTDCDTPGYGDEGNTNSSRIQFYHLNRAKEIARGWLSLPWLTSPLIAKVNLDGTCDAFWDGTIVNFTRRGTDCSNSGEIQAVGLHEYGHGLDANDGNGPSPDKGTGETYGDWTAALITHDSCIGSGFLNSNCDGFGDACTSCTGVRDIDYVKHASGAPHTVGNFTQVFCPLGNAYNGPCGREGHCESQVSSEALWDLAVRDLTNPGTISAWAIMDRLWYLSRPTATAAFTCFTATSTWRSNGCGAGSLWKTMRAVDDDDGDLSNGTPHSGALYAAFNRHSIACTSDVGANINFRGCAQPTPPTVSLAAANNQVTASWSGSSGRYDVYRNEQGCNEGGFVKVANDLPSWQFIDNGVADFKYSYWVVAHPFGNEACSSEPSSCLEITPCQQPAVPSNLTATVVSSSRVDLSWSSSFGASRYHIYHALSPAGPYTEIGTANTTTFSDSTLNSCTAYYVVRAVSKQTCESSNSTQAVAITGACTLTASKNGTGAGTVMSSPVGINCGADCSEPYSYNTAVTLTAVPSTGFVFNGWSGACTGVGQCMVTMSQARLAIAAFASPELTVSSNLSWGGKVTSVPTGIDCGGDCSESYSYNTTVTLTATPTTGYAFIGWSGACTGKGSCTVTLSQARSVVATFLSLQLKVSLSWPPRGRVTSTPAGIDCGTVCTQSFPENTAVTLTAEPMEYGRFVGWEGACTGTGICTVTMTQERLVTANFADLYYNFSVNRSLQGTLTSMPGAINCGVNSTICWDNYLYNALVTITATPIPGFEVLTWTGACYGKGEKKNDGSGLCTVEVTGSLQASAEFGAILSLDIAGAGSGSVTSMPAGINCSADCNNTYIYNTAVTLVANPAPGSVFNGWSGACSGTGTCSVTMSQARFVRATFSVATYTLTLSLIGAGGGTVTSKPAGINCGTDCSERYNPNTVVTLTAEPSSFPPDFKSWSGACTGTGSCTVTMNQAKSVTATFEGIGRDFHTILPPCRVFDSRVTGSQLTSQVPLIINIAGNCGVPVTAKAVSLNVTAIGAPGDGVITLYPGDITLPGTWTISFPPSLNRANNSVMPLAWNGNGTLAAVAVITGGGTMDMALDVNGYFE
jgi:hypothetical protein